MEVKFEIIEKKKPSQRNPLHFCPKCKNLLSVPFVCENIFECSQLFCEECLNGKYNCPECGESSKMIKNEKLESVINKNYILKCKDCQKEMNLIQSKKHNETECKNYNTISDQNDPNKEESQEINEKEVNQKDG